MARIIVYLNDQFLRDIPLTRDTITVGRKPDNDVHLDNHAVSGYHARIITLLNDSFVEDLDSTNGTVVNDTPVRKRALKEGDEIGIYHYRLVYTRRSGSVQPVAPEQMDKTVIIRMDAMGLPQHAADRKLENAVQRISRESAQPPAPEPAPRAAVAPSRPAVSASAAPAALATESRKPETTVSVHGARLHILTGPNAGRALELVKALTTLGRPGIQVAAIQRRGPGYMIIHVDGGASGESPKVNDRHIGNASQGLRHGDVIDIAGVRMEFREA